ncbi:MAG: DUF2330 domain-containing protein [Myxococcales bacterium]|nr:DUF2330 domain-containing protein [Myxococcales bacterium]
MKRFLFFFLSLSFTALWPPNAGFADPCGMVPPAYIGPGQPITRVGAQKTYVFYKNGMESIVLRPGFSGKVDNFGMLIPFPSPPALRKMPDNIFHHIQAAVEPPEVVVHLWRYRRYRRSGRYPMPSAPSAAKGSLSVSSVRVIRQEAMGMYQVAVLEAGSAAALKRWMDRHGYRYPKGMDKVCEDYIRLRWCFVAVKTRVTATRGLQARPGIRHPKTSFPSGGSFNGKVQAMGFRFYTKKLVVPMRLSAYNAGRLHNIVYILTTGPRRINSIPKEFVLRQLSGDELYRNVTQPLPLRIYGGQLKDIPAYRWPSIQQQRNPVPKNGLARDLFASDLEAVSQKQLALDHEEEKKVLLNISERLRMRGDAIDKLHRDAVQEKANESVRRYLSKLKNMTLTVVNGDFPREVLARENLTFTYFRTTKKPSHPQSGVFTRSLGPASARKYLAATLPPKPRKTKRSTVVTNRELIKMLQKLDKPKHTEDILRRLIALGQRAVPFLFGEAIESTSLPQRGWSIVALSEIGGNKVSKQLPKIYSDQNQALLVRAWAAAGMIPLLQGYKELQSMIQTWYSRLPMLERPLRLELLEMTKQNKVSFDQLTQLGQSWYYQKIAKPSLLYLLQKKSLSPRKILLLTKNYSMQSLVAPMILKLSTHEMLTMMVSDPDNHVRRMAAAYLGTFFNQGRKDVPQRVVQAYRFRPNANQVPWHGGALFVPAVNWSREDARELVGNLIRWLLWADIHKQTPLLRQIHNNIRSLSLAYKAGYRSPGWRQIGTLQWLQIWRRATSCDELRSILRQQSVLHTPHYDQALHGCQ